MRPALVRGTGVSWRDVRKLAITPAFKALRRIGVYASSKNLDCCGSCTAARLNRIADEWVGYHDQSVPDTPSEPFEGMYMQHSLEEASKPAVRRAFVEQGLVVDWDGSDTKTILLSLPEPSGTHWARVRFKLKVRALLCYWLELTAHLHALDAREGRALLATYGGVFDSAAAGAPEDGPPGPTDAWKEVAFERSATFKSLDDEGSCRRRTSPEHERIVVDGRTSPYEGMEPEAREQLERYLNGAEVATLTLTEPTVYVDDEPRALKGAALDAVAFRGALKLASYSVLGDEPRGGPAKDKVATSEPRNGKWFNIAELHEALETHLHWIARVDQYNGRHSVDHAFFEGFVETEINGEAAWDCVWGS